MLRIFRLYCTLILGIFAASSSAATAHDPIPLVGGDAHAVSLPSADGAWGGQRRNSVSSAKQAAETVVNYRIAARLDPQTHRIEGEQTLRWRNRSDLAVEVVYFHAYLNAFSDQHSTFMTEAEHFGEAIQLLPNERGYLCLRQISQIVPTDTTEASLLSSPCVDGPNDNLRYVQSDGGPKTDRTVFALKLAHPVPAGQSTELKMRFVSQLPKAIARSGYVQGLHAVAQWFPKIAVLELAGERGASETRWNAHEYHYLSEFYADFGLFDVSITLPKTMRIAATGAPHSQRELAGGLIEHRFVQADIHDFAFIADARFGAPLELQWVSKSAHVVAIKVFFTADYGKHAPIVLTALKASLEHAQDHLAEYPYATLSAVIPPFNAVAIEGMEYPSLFTVTSPEEVLANSYEADALSFVTVHEFFHNYFQGILASNEFEEPWLDEGVNEYWNLQFLEEQGPRALMPGALKRLGMDWRVPQFDLSRATLSRSSPIDAIGANAWQRLSVSDYYDVYPRGALLLRDLQSRWGSKRLRRAMQHYLQTWQFRHPSTADFREALIAGASLCDMDCDQTPFDAGAEATYARLVFAELVYKPGVIDDQLVRIESTCGLSVPVQTSVQIKRNGVQLPQRLQLQLEDGSDQSVTVHPQEKKLQQIQFSSTQCPSGARLDPENRYRLDHSGLDNTVSVHANGLASRRWSAEVLSALTMLYSALLGL